MNDNCTYPKRFLFLKRFFNNPGRIRESEALQNMKSYKKKISLLLLVLTIPFMHIFYYFLNNPGRGAKNLVTDIDRAIPFINIFVIPYIFWYVFIFAVLFYLLAKDEKMLVRTVITIDICLMICYVIYYIFQTTVPRPLVTGNDVLPKLVNMIYSHDQPYNCFPSIHCLTSFIMIRSIFKSKIRNIFNISIITSIAVLIILSTMFIKQHVILDVISAIIIADSIFKLVINFNKENAISWLRRQYSWLMTRKKLQI
jgi:membrane-associated phospholipid phosphatase